MRRVESDLRAGGLLLSLVFSSDESFLSLLDLLDSKVAPGVLGVLLALPKPKAPEPRPKAEEAPELVGEATEVVVMGPIELKGLFFPWLLKLVKRLLEGVSWPSRESWRSFLLTEREGFELLLLACWLAALERPHADM